MSEKSLYDRLGGVFAIAAVVDHFSDAVVQNPIVGKTSKNPALRDWHTKNLDRLPGLKFMRTLWVCNVAGGPQEYTATKPGKTTEGLEEAHRDLRISPAEFDEVAAELGRTLDFFKVPNREKDEVLGAFAAHKKEVTEGHAARRHRSLRRRVRRHRYATPGRAAWRTSGTKGAWVTCARWPSDGPIAARASARSSDGPPGGRKGGPATAAGRSTRAALRLARLPVGAPATERADVAGGSPRPSRGGTGSPARSGRPRAGPGRGTTRAARPPPRVPTTSSGS